MTSEQFHPTGAKRPVVLVVDDDIAILRALERLLLRLELDVITHDRAFGLLNIIAERRPSLVLLDVMMPGLDGPSVAELVRADASISSTRILLHSAMDEAALASKARACRADGYISKGCGFQKICDRVLEELKGGGRS